MNSPLEAQRQRLQDELKEAEEQIAQLNQLPSPNPQMINYYHDQLHRLRHMLELLDDHLGDDLEKPSIKQKN